MKPPSLSIIIPCYNGSKSIPLLKASLCSLPFSHEIIFVDDGSTDDSEQSIKKHFPNASYHHQDNAGVASARNTGAQQAQGDYLLLLDCDDVVHTNSLQSRLEQAQADDLDVLTASWRMEIRKGEDITLESIRAMETPDDIIAALLKGNWWGPPHAYLVKRSSYWGVKGSDASLTNAQDFDLWLRLAIAYKKWGSSSTLCGHYVRDLKANSLARGPRQQYWHDTETAVDKAVDQLKENDSFSPSRREAAAQRLHHVARNVYALDKAWYDRILRKTQVLCPDFKPEGSALYRTTARLMGLKKAEQIAHIKQRLTGS